VRLLYQLVLVVVVCGAIVTSTALNKSKQEDSAVECIGRVALLERYCTCRCSVGFDISFSKSCWGSMVCPIPTAIAGWGDFVSFGFFPVYACSGVVFMDWCGS